MIRPNPFHSIALCCLRPPAVVLGGSLSGVVIVSLALALGLPSAAVAAPGSVVTPQNKYNNPTNGKGKTGTNQPKMDEETPVVFKFLARQKQKYQQKEYWLVGFFVPLDGSTQQGYIKDPNLESDMNQLIERTTRAGGSRGRCPR